ncbi:MAG: GNAT family N-acetyltransferase [Gemmatimonadales bacterium]
MNLLFTDRLILRPFKERDIDGYAAMCADAEVMRYLGTGEPVNRDDAWRQMAMFAGHWQLRGYGMWALEERSSGAFVGRAGLHFPEGWPEPEVGWTLAREFWGQGYAHEAAVAALDHAFGDLGWQRACSLIDPSNLRSIRLAERLGERYERAITLRGSTLSLYAIGARDWLHARRDLPA